MRPDGRLPSYEQLMARHEQLKALKAKVERTQRIYVLIDKIPILMALKEELV